MKNYKVHKALEKMVDYYGGMRNVRFHDPNLYVYECYKCRQFLTRKAYGPPYRSTMKVHWECQDK